MLTKIISIALIAFGVLGLLAGLWVLIIEIRDIVYSIQFSRDTKATELEAKKKV